MSDCSALSGGIYLAKDRRCSGFDGDVRVHDADGVGVGLLVSSQNAAVLPEELVGGWKKSALLTWNDAKKSSSSGLPISISPFLRLKNFTNVRNCPR